MDKTAARVTSKGYPYEPAKLNGDYFESETPIATKPEWFYKKHRKNIPDLRARKVGRFLVLGLADSQKLGIKKGRWVVRCSCGRYGIRTAKAIRNPKNVDDCCLICRHTRYLGGGDG